MADHAQDLLLSIDLEATLMGVSGSLTVEQVEKLMRDDPDAFIARLKLKPETIDAIEIKDVKPAEFIG